VRIMVPFPTLHPNGWRFCCTAFGHHDEHQIMRIGWRKGLNDLNTRCASVSRSTVLENDTLLPYVGEALASRQDRSVVTRLL
jgi:hypothetical protein